VLPKQIKHTKDCRLHALRTHNQIRIQDNTFAGRQKLIANEKFTKPYSIFNMKPTTRSQEDITSLLMKNLRNPIRVFNMKPQNNQKFSSKQQFSTSPPDSHLTNQQDSKP
jgi:hypothetical protein